MTVHPDARPGGEHALVTKYPPERQREIIALLVAAKGRLGVAEISHALGVTTETVRRDLDVLERRGTLRRVHGGAELVNSTPFEQALAARHAEQSTEKNVIARRLVAEVPDDGVVVLDSGSLTYVFASLMPAERQLTVVTNNLPAARLLADRENLRVITLPGMIRGLTAAAVDAATADRLADLTADLAIVGVNGITPGQGLTTTNPEEAGTKRAMLLAARRRVVPAISGRVGRNSFCSFARVNEIDLVVTDSGAEVDVLSELAALGPEVVVAR